NLQVLSIDGRPLELLDSSFGVGGRVTTAIGASNDQASSTVTQPDGKVVVAGYSAGDFALVRYNPDGSLDTTFDSAGRDGKVTTSFGGFDDGAYGVALQSDGKIVVAGFYNNGSNYDFAVARYNSDGSLDTTFGSGGKVTTSFGSSHDIAHGLAIQP